MAAQHLQAFEVMGDGDIGKVRVCLFTLRLVWAFFLLLLEHVVGGMNAGNE
jgi:hypothetical protein